MPVTSLRSHQPFASDALAAAERAMPLAPSVTLAPGLSVVPQLAIPADWKKRGASAAKNEGGAVLVSRKLVPQVQRSIMLVRRLQRELSPVAQLVWDLIADEAASRQENLD